MRGASLLEAVTGTPAVPERTPIVICSIRGDVRSFSATLAVPDRREGSARKGCRIGPGAAKASARLTTKRWRMEGVENVTGIAKGST